MQAACIYAIEMVCTIIRKKYFSCKHYISIKRIYSFDLPKTDRSTIDAIGKTQTIPKKKIEKY